MAMLNVERESGDTQRTSDAQNTPEAIVSERFSKLLSKSFLDSCPALTEGFRSNRPCPHVIIEEFLEPNFCTQLLNQFPVCDGRVLELFRRNGNRGGKSKVRDLRALGESYIQLDDLLKSTFFIDLISRITGIPDLIYDPTYYGGGTHESLNGERLLPHIDYNYHPETGSYRRLNLLVYLNKGWQTDWGGNFDLHSDPLNLEEDEVTSCRVGFNNAVILETSSKSWHGFGSIELPEDQIANSRKSIAVYYYTKKAPDYDTDLNRSTVYVDEPLPQRFSVGYRLDSRDLVKLRELFQIRGWHSRELLDEVINFGLGFVNWLKTDYDLNQQDVDRIEELLGTIDLLVDRLERDHLRLRNPGKDAESNEASWLRIERTVQGNKPCKDGAELRPRHGRDEAEATAREGRIARLETEAIEGQERTAELEANLTERTQEAEELEKQLTAMRNSTIWRSTAPLRYLLSKLR
jgi:hypothetical protein